MTDILTGKSGYHNVRQRMIRACESFGRKEGEVSLVAVSKFHPINDIERVASLGQVDFGENYVQEAMQKMHELEKANVRWHMIGHVQTKKASTVAGNFALLHTLDSIKLANALEKSLNAKNLDQATLIEVNIGAETQKSGILPEVLPNLCEHVLGNCPHLRLLGFMCLPPVFDAGEAARPFFAQLRVIRDKMEMEFGVKFPHLSMGMSGDFEWAIAEGATIVRVGTDIFGPRPAKNI